MKYIFSFIAALMMLIASPVEGLAQKFSGNATYYGNRWHGRRTSSGEKYHKDSLTCAHRTLPFGTMLRVKNARNGKEVIVRVTDRGPFRKGAVIDLSMAAAKEIAMVADGIVRVEAMLIKNPLGAPDDKPAVMPDLQLFDFRDGSLFSAAEYAQAKQEERASQLRTASIQMKHQAPYRILDAQHQTAKAKK